MKGKVNTMIDSISILKTVMSKSPYFEYLYRNIGMIEFMFNDDEKIYLKNEKGKLILAYMPEDYEEKADLIIELDKNELYEYYKFNTTLQKFRISTGENGSSLNPMIEKIIQRIFLPPMDGKYPMTDIIDLIYGALFKFTEPRVIWKSEKKQLYILRYKNAYNDLDAYITYGFANPNLQPSGLILDEGKVSGYGYEMLIFAGENDMDLVKEFIDWVQYLDNTEKHIFQGQYLEYGEGVKIPNTDMAGFLILNPLGLPYTMPVDDGFATFNLFLAVTEEELKLAKQKDIYEVANELNEKGYINYSPQVRKSVV